MIQLKTAKNELFEIEWAGVSTIDGALRFGTRSVDTARLLAVFTNPENCSVLTRVFDGEEKTFEGYTVFRGITIDYDGITIVALSKI